MKLFLESHKALMTGKFLTDLANTSAYVFNEFPELNWAGFYLNRNNHLWLGPFQGKPACTEIKWNHGVCGTSAAKKETLIVPDVDAFPGHIRCDEGSKSELVVPLILGQKVIGVLDLDSPRLSRFNLEDAQMFEKLCDQLLSRQNCTEVDRFLESV
jgi:GAF domain-containing protein